MEEGGPYVLRGRKKERKCSREVKKREGQLSRARDVPLTRTRKRKLLKRRILKKEAWKKIAENRFHGDGTTTISQKGGGGLKKVLYAGNSVVFREYIVPGLPHDRFTGRF